MDHGNSEECSLENLTENGVSVSYKKGKNDPPLQDMALNRSLILAALTDYVKTGQSVLKPPRCLEAVAGCGILGLAWKKALGEEVEVFINDPDPELSAQIAENAKLNYLQAHILNKDPCVLLHENGYNFVYINCAKDAAFYLDSLMRHCARKSIVALSTKDDTSLHASNGDAAFRRYNGRIIRTCYSAELGVRLVLAETVRAAAKYNKGVQVLCCFKYKMGFTIIAAIKKDPLEADECLKKLRLLSHCMVCEERIFHEEDVGFPDETRVPTMPGKCTEGEHQIRVLGPLWAGEIFDENFLNEAKLNTNDPNLKVVLELILEEARCPTKPLTDEERKKRPKIDETCPAFYYSLHKRHLKVANQKSAKDVISVLRTMGFRASRTHFEKTAIRTNAPLEKISEALLLSG